MPKGLVDMRVVSQAILGVTVITMLAANARGAEIPDSGRLLRERVPQPALVPSTKFPDIRIPKESTKPPLADTITFRVTSFVYTGNTLFSASELDQIMDPVIGKKLTLAELDQAVSQITQEYRNRGYFLARATLPSQSIKNGQPIKIEILEGILEKINLKTVPPETRVPSRLLELYRTQIKIGKPVNIDELSKTAMLLNELPALRSRVVLEPGKELGSTIATLEVAEDKPYSLSLFTDNYGSYSTGYYRVGAGLELYSPFKLGDRLALSGQSSTSGDTQSVGANWSVPIFSAGTRVVVDYSGVRYNLGRSFESLGAKGEAHGFNLAIVAPLVRRTNLYLNASIAGDGKLLNDQITSFDYNNKRHLISGQAAINLYAADSLFIAGYTSFSATYTGGVLGFDTASAKGNDQNSSTGLHTEGLYHKIFGSFYRTQTIYGDLSLLAGAKGQWSDKNIDSAEQLSIGGPTAVRAYPIGEASADRGVVTTVELRYLLPFMKPIPGRLQLAGLFDHGYAEIDAKPAASTQRNVRHLHGIGFGVNWQWGELISTKTSVAWALGDLPTSDNPDGKKPTVFFQIVARY